MAATMAGAFLLAGCSASGGDGSTDSVAVEGGAPVAGGEMGMADEMAPDMATGARAPLPTEQQVIRTGYLAMRVDDVTKTVFDVHALTKKRQGLVASEDVSSNGDATYATITSRIPSADLDGFIADVSALGTVDSLNVTAADVTSQVVDLDARITALQTSIDRLTQLLAQASRIEDLLSIETQLAQRQSELDSLTAQRDYLGDQVALSTITVSLSPITSAPEVDAPGFLTGLQNGWAAFVSLIMVALTALGFMLPFLVIVAIIAVPVTFALVRASHRRRAQNTEPQASGITTADSAAPPAP
jgi:hypothetical protein